MTALRPIKPLPFEGLTPAKVGRDLPELVWVAPTELLVDATYQRNLSERSIRLIRRMVENFAWNRVKPLIGVRVDRAIHIIDGQHTGIAAATLKIPKVPVFVVAAGTVDERARAFVGHNTDRLVVSPFDIYQALLASGDEEAMDVANVCRRAGVRVRQISPSSSISPGDTAAVGRVRGLVARRGVQDARRVLQCLVSAKRAPISSAEITAADHIICVERKAIDLDVLAAVIRIDGTDGLLEAQAKAKKARSPIWKELASRWLQLLDRRAK
ncbi:hypothetical protein OOZ54_13295 [Rhodopseudomonas palustris]|uniref:DUF6551 family protein n=1 Tax=Rhodopseudomonas palustris TaxID=1076 RepID=UPI0022F0DE5E|nr:DUF6551 family protein [Rhodopseudomonas palustris]WBU27639.1 hypothetical protein OOZ54_13295 [Rhodopseudomonas palustris]